MNLRTEILQEHSKKVTLKIVDYVGDNPDRFKALVDVYLQGPYRVTQRSAWALSLCVEKHPELLKPHLNALIKFLHKPGIHDAVKRNTMRLLQFVEIPKRSQGKIATLCFDYLQNKKEPVAIQAFAMSVLMKIVVENPELFPSLKIILEDQLPYAKPAFQSRARKILKAGLQLQL